MKILEQINKDLDELACQWANSNAHGIPCTEGGHLHLDSTSYLRFKDFQYLRLGPMTPDVLRSIADILEKYY